MISPFSKKPKVEEKRQIIGFKENGIKLFGSVKKKITEASKGRAEAKLHSHLLKNEIGEPHQEDYVENEKIIKEVALAAAQVQATVDFIMRGGVFITSPEENKENAQKIVECIEEFMEKINSDTFLRNVATNMLTFGGDYREIIDETTNTEEKRENPEILDLKFWHPKGMYIKKDKDSGDIVGYNQWWGNFKQDPVPFELDEIVYFPYNRIGQDVYGTSLIKPMKRMLYDKLSMEASMIKILKRKANAPLIFLIGNKEGTIMPKKGDIDDIISDLQTMKDDTEWVFPAVVDPKVLGFEGKIVDLKPVIEYYDSQLIFAGRVPEVLLGKGKVPEGLAKFQTEAMEGRAKSIQESIEKELETKVFPKVLAAKGLEGKAEVNWGAPTEEDKQEQISGLTKLLDSRLLLSDQVRDGVNKKIADILDIEIDEKKEEEARQRRQQQQQRPPPQGQQQQGEEEEKHSHIHKEKLKIEYVKIPKELTNKHVGMPLENAYFKSLNEMNNNAEKNTRKLMISAHEKGEINLKEEIPRARYTALVREIERAIELAYTESNEIVDAHTETNFIAGMELAEKRLDMNLVGGKFERDTIRVLKESGAKLVKGVEADVKKNISFEIQQGVLGRESIPQISKRIGKVFDASKLRLEKIARTETQRALSEAELAGYKQSGVVEKVRWVTAQDERVCPICEPRDGRVFTLERAENEIPIHVMCRCDWVPIVVR